MTRRCDLLDVQGSSGVLIAHFTFAEIQSTSALSCNRRHIATPQLISMADSQRKRSRFDQEPPHRDGQRRSRSRSPVNRDAAQSHRSRSPIARGDDDDNAAKKPFDANDAKARAAEAAARISAMLKAKPATQSVAVPPIRSVGRPRDSD
jgi:hypothetical protein